MIRSTIFHLRSSTRPAALAGLVLTLSSSALAQSSSDLPMSPTEAISINGSQATQINEFVQAWKSKALSENPQDTKKALEALTKPLRDRGVSVAFRQAYTQSILPLMDELDKQNTIGGTLSSLRLAGDLATPGAASHVRSALGADDLGVRLFAVARAGHIFSTTAEHGPAMTENDATALIDTIEELAKSQSTDQELLRACVRALSAGASLSSKDMGQTRSRAIIAMSNLVGEQLRLLTINDDPSFAQELALTAASSATTSISDISSQTTPQAVRAAVGLGGDIISVSLRRVLGNTIKPVSRRDMAIRSVQAGESLLYFALRKDAELNNRSIGSIRPTSFAEELKAGKDKEFRNQASSLLGAGSELVTRFKFDDERFLR